jgi:hypothetical protein
MLIKEHTLFHALAAGIAIVLMAVRAVGEILPPILLDA